MGLYRKFAAYCTIHWCKSFVSTRVCCAILNKFFEMRCRKSIEFWNNRCILGYIWIASIVHVMGEWFPFNRLQMFTIAPIVRVELETIQAIVIVPIARVVSVVFPYDRPDHLGKLGRSYGNQALVYICNNSLHESHSCKDTSVCYKKTLQS